MIDIEAKFLGQGQQQAVGSQEGIGNVGSDEVITDRIEEPTAEECLAGADLADDLDEALTTLQRQLNHLQCPVVTIQIQEEIRVRGQGKRQLTHAEKF